MSVSVSISGSGAVGLGVGVGSYQPEVYVPLKALFLVTKTYHTSYTLGSLTSELWVVVRRVGLEVKI